MTSEEESRDWHYLNKETLDVFNKYLEQEGEIVEQRREKALSTVSSDESYEELMYCEKRIGQLRKLIEERKKRTRND